VLRREILETLRQTLFIMSFLLVMPIVFFIQREVNGVESHLAEFVLGGYGILWIITSVYVAYNMFRSELRDGAIEYLLSLPVSKPVLLFMKVVPRISILIILGILFYWLNGQWGFFSSVWGMVAFLLFIQICGFVLGITGRSNWLARTVLAFLAVEMFIVISIPPEFLWNGPLPDSRLLYLAFEALVLPVLLLPAYSDWDLRPASEKSGRLAKLAIIPLILMAVPVVHLFAGKG
jgi:ABC-type transport system involved in cytochrome c biogenesis permease component